MRLTDYKALTFDCYGTLIDWESGMIEALRTLTDRVQEPLTRNRILEAHARHESAQQLQTPAKRYGQLLPIVCKRMAEEFGVPVTVDQCEAYGMSVRDWPAFVDSPGALQYLKKYYKLIVLSNVDNRSFGYSNAKLQVDFDAIYTAQDIGSYKPDPRNFAYMIEQLAAAGTPKHKILHTAQSLFHDHGPANAAGLASAWIDRRHDRPGHGATAAPTPDVRWDFRFTSLGEMAAAHRAR